MRPFLRPGARVLDVGSADCALERQIPGLAAYVAIDPAFPDDSDEGRRRLVRGRFPEDLPDGEPFDAIVMLAVLEHFPEAAYPTLAAACARRLRVGGHVLVTAPAPIVDEILGILVRLRLIDGMALDEHHHFDPARTLSIFAIPELELARASRFELGLNHLFVFRRR